MTAEIKDRPRPAQAARHSEATLRALDSSRELVELLKRCDKAIYLVNVNVDENAVELVARISQDLAALSGLAERLRTQLREAAQSRSGFWEPATDPFASTRKNLARRVQNAA